MPLQLQPRYQEAWCVAHEQPFPRRLDELVEPSAPAFELLIDLLHPGAHPVIAAVHRPGQRRADFALGIDLFPTDLAVARVPPLVGAANELLPGGLPVALWLLHTHILGGRYPR